MLITLPKLLKKIKQNNVTIEIEKRLLSKGWYDYGFKKNHGFIVGNKNSSDNKEWDVLIFGYKNLNLYYGQRYKINKILGIIFLSDGNHKLIPTIPYKRGFDKNLYKKQVNKFIRNYKKRWATIDIIYYEI